MKLVVFSHKPVWKSDKSVTGFATDGGFAFHMAGLSEIFDETVVAVPEYKVSRTKGEVPFFGHNVSIHPITPIMVEDIRRKLVFPFWLMRNIWTYYKLIRNADAIHVPIPNDMGTIAMLMANFMKKRLLVRHCGNWYVQVTKAEVFWKRFMEKNAGGRNVFMATGGSLLPPSKINPNIHWIFSTTLRNIEIESLSASVPMLDVKNPRLIIVCRQIKEKGTEKILEAIVLLKKEYPGIHLDIVGDGNYLSYLKQKSVALELSKQVTFHHKAGHDKVLELLKASHIFTFPTRASEGFPKALLEAMAAGLVVIANPVSVIPELLKDGAGVLLPEDTVEALAAAIKNVIEHPVELKKMQMKAQKNAGKYTIENWSKTIKGYLEDSWKEKTRSGN